MIYGVKDKSVDAVGDFVRQVHNEISHPGISRPSSSPSLQRGPGQSRPNSSPASWTRPATSNGLECGDNRVDYKGKIAALNAKQEEKNAKQEAFQRARNHVLHKDHDFREGLVAKHEALERRQMQWAKHVKEENLRKASSAQQQRNERAKNRKELKRAEAKLLESLRYKHSKGSPRDTSPGCPGNRSPSARDKGSRPATASAPSSPTSRANTPFSNSRPSTRGTVSTDASESNASKRRGPQEEADDFVFELQRAHHDRNKQFENAMNLVRDNERRIEAYKRKLISSNTHASLETGGDDQLFEESTINQDPGSPFSPSNEASNYHSDFWNLSSVEKIEAMQRKTYIMERRQNWLEGTMKINDEMWKKNFMQKNEARHTHFQAFMESQAKLAEDIENSELTKRRNEALDRVQRRKTILEGEAKKMENTQLARQAQATQKAQKRKEYLTQLAKEHDEKVKETKEVALQMFEDTKIANQKYMDIKDQRSKSVVHQNLDFLKEHSKESSEKTAEKCQKAQQQKDNIEEAFRHQTRTAMEKRLEKSESNRKLKRLTLGQRREDLQRRRKEGILGGTSTDERAELSGFLAMGGKDAGQKANGASKEHSGDLSKRLRDALMVHVKVIGLEIKDVFQMMDINNNGQVSFIEFQAGLEKINFDPLNFELGTMEDCFQGLTQSGGLLLLPMLLGGPDVAAQKRNSELHGDSPTEKNMQIRKSATQSLPKKRHVKRLYDTGTESKEERRRGALLQVSQDQAEEMEMAQTAGDDTDDNEEDEDDVVGEATHTFVEDDFVREVQDDLQQGQARKPSRTRNTKSGIPTGTVSQALIFLESKRMGMATSEAFDRAKRLQ